MGFSYTDPVAQKLHNAAEIQKEQQGRFPPCRTCGERDEVYSKYVNRADDPSTWTPTMEQLIAAGLGCYRCGI